MRFRTVSLLTLLLLALAAAPGFAQAAAPATTSETATGAAEAVPGTTASESAVADPVVADQLDALLRVHPPEVGAILQLDPTLLSDPTFVGRHPELAALVARHPELAANPRLYLGSVHLPDRLDRGSRALDKFLEGTMIFSVLLLFILTFVWLIRTIVQERRWSRLSRTQSEVHGKLLDRFTANEDLIAYVQSPAGRRFLESAPIPIESEPGAVAAPIARMFWSIQIGIVVAAGALGLLLVSSRFEKDASTSLFALGTVALCVGAGFAISGAVSYLLSRRMGLWPRPQELGRGAE